MVKLPSLLLLIILDKLYINNLPRLHSIVVLIVASFAGYFLDLLVTCQTPLPSWSFYYFFDRAPKGQLVYLIFFI